MSYTVIAQETILMANASSSGSKEERTFVILELFADEITPTEIGIHGDPLYVMGSRGNDMFFPFAPIQIQFSIIDRFGFRDRFKNRAKKDFKLQVKNGETVEYELYLYLPSSNSEYYEPNPEIDLVATNAIGLLKNEYFRPDDTNMEIKDFLFECLSRLGFDFGIELYSKWSSSDNSKTFPLGYRFTKSTQVKFSEDRRISFYEVLENFCEQYNLQLYQIDDVWIFLERKIRLNAPILVNGVDLESEEVVSRSLSSILNADTVLRKPKSQFKPGLTEIKTQFKIGDGFLENIDFSDLKITSNSIPNWTVKTSGVEVLEGDNGLFITLNNAPGNVGDGGWLKQRTRIALANIASQRDYVKFNYNLEIVAAGNPLTDEETYSINYFRALFYTISGTIYILNDDHSWEEYVGENTTRFTSLVGKGTSADVFEEFTIIPPSGTVGYLEVEFRMRNTGAEDPIDDACEVNIVSNSLEFLPEISRVEKLLVNSRGLHNPSSLTQKFGSGDLDTFGNIFTYEYLDSNDEWVVADYISNDGSTESIFNLAPYQKLCQANRDQIEYSTIHTWKYLFPDFLKTIILDQESEPDLYTIPLEVKWNMVTGEIEIYSAAAFEDTTGITSLSFYSEDEYEEIDSETIITDQGELLYGFTKGSDSEDGRGFEVEFDAPELINASSANIEVDGVNYEIDTLILG